MPTIQRARSQTPNRHTVASRSLLAAMLIVVMLLSVQCVPKGKSLQFYDGDKLTRSLEMEPLPGRKLTMSAIVGIGPLGEFSVTLYLIADLSLGDSLQWHEEHVRAFYKDSPLQVAPMDHGYPTVSEKDQAKMTIVMMGHYEKSELWTGLEKQPNPQHLSIDLDSVITWNGKPVKLETIRAVLNPGPYPF